MSLRPATKNGIVLSTSAAVTSHRPSIDSMRMKLPPSAQVYRTVFARFYLYTEQDRTFIQSGIAHLRRRHHGRKLSGKRAACKHLRFPQRRLFRSVLGPRVVIAG